MIPRFLARYCYGKTEHYVALVSEQSFRRVILLSRQINLRSLGLTVIILVPSLYPLALNAKKAESSADYCHSSVPANPRAPLVCNPVYHDVSAKRLGDIHPLTIENKGPRVIHEVRHLPIIQTKGAGTDPVVQQTAGAALVTVDSGFEGLGKGLGYPSSGSPPDTTLAVGPEHFVEWVNTDIAVFDKRTPEKPRYGPVAANVLWSDFSASDLKSLAHRCAVNNDGDPIVMFDRIAKRWLFSQFAYIGGPPYLQCIAVSTSSDPLGTYARYAYAFDLFNDYGKFALWPDGYYASFNMFAKPAGGPKGSEACAFDRDRMIKGDSALMVCFALRQFSGLLPADLDGPSLPNLESGGTKAPSLFLNMESNGLNVWKLTADWAQPEKSTFVGPSPISGVQPFAFSCRSDTSHDPCMTVPQKDSTALLESMGDRLMYRLSYRNLGDHEALVANHAVQVNLPAGGSQIAFRWYEIRKNGKTFAVSNSGTYAPDTTSRWMASAAMDKLGDIALAYSASSQQEVPSIRYTGREADTKDKANILSGERVLMAGSASQTIGAWGDYTTLALDPTDDCTFWFIGQYLTKNDQDSWHTQVSTVKFTRCK